MGVLLTMSDLTELRNFQSSSSAVGAPDFDDLLDAYSSSSQKEREKEHGEKYYIQI